MTLINSEEVLTWIWISIQRYLSGSFYVRFLRLPCTTFLNLNGDDNERYQY